MLRKLLVAIICLPFALAGYAAQLTATLQSGDKLTPFYGVTAFTKAYEAAIDGDVITLSTGQFNTVKIEKSISVIGSYAFHDDDAKATKMITLTVASDNVTLEGINFTGTLTIEGADNLSISRCKMYKLAASEKEGHPYHDTTIVTDCLIVECAAMKLSKNAVFKNSCINSFSDLNKSENLALIENCNIPVLYHYQGTYYRTWPYAIYRNCFLGLYNRNGSSPTFAPDSPCEFHNNLIYRSYYYYPTATIYYKEWKIDLTHVTADNMQYNGINGVAEVSALRGYSSMEAYEQDGKKYGPIDHKAYPAVPEITSAKIDTQTDADGKLHVKITAVARD